MWNILSKIKNKVNLLYIIEKFADRNIEIYYREDRIVIIKIEELDLELRNNISEIVETSKCAESLYYGYKVCAMIVDEAGNKYKGVNFEPSNGKSVCAESTAVGEYLMSDRKTIKYIVLYGAGVNKDKSDDVFCFPCGNCRQMLFDFLDKDTIIYGVNETANKVNKVILKELIPYAFGCENLL